MEFITEQGDKPWVLHLSYIKPHWPYVAPDPYHAMYGPQDVLPAQRNEGEREDPHPVYRGFMNYTPSTTFSRDDVRENVIPTYMGLITQIDDQVAGAQSVHLRKGAAEEGWQALGRRAPDDVGLNVVGVTFR